MTSNIEYTNFGHDDLSVDPAITAAGTPFVLVIDDDPAIVALLLTLLRDEEGFRTRSAPSMKQALEETASTPPAMVVLDVSLPGERLVDALAQLRALPGWEQVPVALCSAQADLERVARDVGAVASLRKPFDLDAVIALVDRYAHEARQIT